MKKVIITMVVATALFACTSEKESVITTDNDEIVISPIFPDIQTKATENGFETGDQIGVFITQWENGKPVSLQIGGNIGSNLTLTNLGSSWSLSPKVYWNDGKYDIYAYYPKDKITSINEYSFSVYLDQTVPATDKTIGTYAMSDFLWAKSTGLERMSTVPLSFKHKMSKLIINLIKGRDYEGDIPQDAVVYIHNTVPDAIIDLATGDVIKSPHSSSKTIKALQNQTGKYSAIIVPQMLANRLPLIEIECGKVSYLLESKFNFKSGMCHIINITLDDNPQKVAISIGGEIENWNQ